MRWSRPLCCLAFSLLLRPSAAQQHYDASQPVSAANPHPYVRGRECGERMTSRQLFAALRTGPGSGSPCASIEWHSPEPLSAFDVKELVSLLDDQHPMREIDLSGSEIGDEKMALLAPAFGSAVQFGCGELDLSRVAIGDAGAGALARVLGQAMGAAAPYFPTKYGSRYGLKLDLGNNRLGDAVASDLAELLPFLSELDLTGNRLGDAGARALLAALPASPLRELDLEWNEISSSVIAELRAAVNRDGQRVDVDAGQQRPPSDPSVPPPPQPPVGGGTAGDAEGGSWSDVYDAIEALEKDGLLEPAPASALRRMAASDHVGVTRVFAKFGGFDADPALLARRLTELVPKDEL